MERLNKKESRLFHRFSKIEYVTNHTEIKGLHRTINRHLNQRNMENKLLSDVLILLEIYFTESRNIILEEIFDYTKKINNTYRLAKNITINYKDLTSDNFDLYDLVISSSVLPYVETIEEAEELSQKTLKALEKNKEAVPTYVKSKFNIHINMVERCLKADFFEVDHVNEKERSKLVKDFYEYHLNEALKVCEDTDEIEEKYKLWLKVKAAVMARNSKEISDNLDDIMKVTISKNFNDLVREEVSYYSFDHGFVLNKKHFDIVLGIRIRKLRERLGIRLPEFAYELGYSDTCTLRSIEKGEKNISIFRLAKVADYFDVTIETLCYGVKHKGKKPRQKMEFKKVS